MQHCDMTHLRTGDLVRLTGYSRATIARRARAGDIPGTFAPDGVHFAYEDGDDLRQWIAEHKQRREKFSNDRATGPQAAGILRARRGGQTFHRELCRLVNSGDPELMKQAKLISGLMQKSLDGIRQQLEKSAAAGKR